MHKKMQRKVLPDGLGLNQLSNNRLETPSPDPGLGYPIVFLPLMIHKHSDSCFLAELRERRQPNLTRRVATNISSCLRIVGVVPDSWVILWDPHVYIGYVPEVLVREHSLCHVFGWIPSLVSWCSVGTRCWTSNQSALSKKQGTPQGTLPWLHPISSSVCRYLPFLFPV